MKEIKLTKNQNVIIEGAKIYNKYAKKYFGEYALLNVIKECE